MHSLVINKIFRELSGYPNVLDDHPAVFQAIGSFLYSTRPRGSATSASASGRR